MCYSFKSSITAWFIALLASFILLLISNNRNLALWISAFTLTFTQIQVIEAIIWKSLEVDRNADVSSIARYIPILLWFQPFIQCIFGYYYSKNIFLLYLSLLYLFIIFMEINTEDTFSVKISSRGHLMWQRFRGNEEILIIGDNIIYACIYLFGLFVPLFFINNEHFITKFGLIAYGLFSMFYSLSYGIKEFGSMWCFHAVNYILIAILTEFLNDYLLKI